MLSLLLLFSLTNAQAATKAIEIEFPDEVELPFARTSPLKPLTLRAKWVGVGASPELVAWVSFGRVERFTRTNTGFDGEWWPPDPAFPGELQIVVSALVDGQVVHSAQTAAISAEIELAGRSEPNAAVEILIRGQEPFGPVKAAHDGRFKLLVTVPPHVENAVVRSRDHLGNTTKKNVDLFVPKVSTLAVACPFTRAVAGTVGLPLAIATAKEKAGTVTIRAAQGVVSGLDYRAPEALKASTETLTFTSALGESTCVFPLVAGPAVSAEAIFEPPFLLADGKAKTQVKLVARDRFGNEQSDVEAWLYEGETLLKNEIVSVALAERRDLRLQLKQKGRPDIITPVTLFQIPDRGVRLLVGSTPLCVRVLPMIAVVELSAVDESGAELTRVTRGTEVCVERAQGSVLFTHGASGQSLLVPGVSK